MSEQEFRSLWAAHEDWLAAGNNVSLPPEPPNADHPRDTSRRESLPMPVKPSIGERVAAAAEAHRTSLQPSSDRAARDKLAAAATPSDAIN